MKKGLAMMASYQDYTRCGACGAVFLAAEGVCPTCGTRVANPTDTEQRSASEQGYHTLLTALLSASELERRQILAYYPVTGSAEFLAYLAAQRDAVHAALGASGQGALAPLVVEQFNVVERGILEGSKHAQGTAQWAEDTVDRGTSVDGTFPAMTSYPEVDTYDASTQFEEDSAGWPGGAYENPDSSYYEPYTYDD
jgi:hypothetical protein